MKHSLPAVRQEEPRDAEVVSFIDRRAAILRDRVSIAIEDAKCTYVRTAMRIRREMTTNVGLEKVEHRCARLRDAATESLGGPQALEQTEETMHQLDLLCSESALFLRLLEDSATRSELEDAARVLRYTRLELPVWRGEQVHAQTEDTEQSILEGVLTRFKHHLAEYASRRGA